MRRKRLFQEMFDHRGKTTRIIGELRIKIYHELYNHITQLQENGQMCDMSAFKC
mgnify:CR=1 FL=1